MLLSVHLCWNEKILWFYIGPLGQGKTIKEWTHQIIVLFHTVTAVLLRYVEPGSFDVKDAEAAIDEAAPHCCASIPLNTSNCVSTST